MGFIFEKRYASVSEWAVHNAVPTEDILALVRVTIATETSFRVPDWCFREIFPVE